MKKPKPRTMLISVPHDVADAFRNKVSKVLGKRAMSPLIVSWMKEYINDK